MFETIPMAPPDVILGLTETFKKDPNPNKINLGVGVYKDAEGNTPILESVRQAEKRIFEKAKSKSYLPIAGSPEFAECTGKLLFGEDHPVWGQDRIRTAHTPGGTGALRVASDFLKRCTSVTTIWMSEPTWANHPAIFDAAGLATKTYPYYDMGNKCLDFASMMKTLENVPSGDAILLHACCHNPSGADLSLEQWQEVSTLVREKGLIPLVDFAYQGFAIGLEQDAAGVRMLCNIVDEALICSSFSKNFGLYQDRCGALTVLARTSDNAACAFSQIEKAIRANYSNPPAHGGEIVVTILKDSELCQLWRSEVDTMRNRIHEMRCLFVESLREAGVTQDFSFIKDQRGMFSFSGLTGQQVALLKEKYAIYIVGSGRINVAGMTKSNMKTLCSAIADVLKASS